MRERTFWRIHFRCGCVRTMDDVPVLPWMCSEHGPVMARGGVYLGRDIGNQEAE
jgi:hypothetical protein